MKPVGVILAGGRSSRMGGGDKALAMLNGATMLAHVLAAVRPQLSAVLINSNSDPALFAQYSTPVLADCLPGRLGPLAGLLTGMKWAHRHYRDATHIFSVPCDTPLLPADLVPRLAAALDRDGAEIAIASDGDYRHPTLGLWPINLADRLESDLALGVRAVQAWLASFTVADVSFDADCLMNINAPEDLAAARSMFCQA